MAERAETTATERVEAIRHPGYYLFMGSGSAAEVARIVHDLKRKGHAVAHVATVREGEEEKISSVTVLHYLTCAVCIRDTNKISS